MFAEAPSSPAGLPCFRIRLQARLWREPFRGNMIQRKQSAYLLLGSLSLGAVLLFWPGAVGAAFSGYAPFAFVGGALAGALGLVSIFMYGNRERQHAMARAAQLCALLWMALFTAGLYIGGGSRADGEAIAVVAPMAALVCAYGFFWLARRAIQSDIALVRSADRIR